MSQIQTMASSKRKTFSIEDEMGRIRKIENGCNQADIWRVIKYSNLQFVTRKIRQLIISAHETILIKRFRTPSSKYTLFK